MLKRIRNWFFPIIAASFWINSIIELITMVRNPSFGEFRILFFSIIISIAFTIIADISGTITDTTNKQEKDSVSLIRRILKDEERIEALEKQIAELQSNSDKDNT